jgi:hypothetical protein
MCEGEILVGSNLHRRSGAIPSGHTRVGTTHDERPPRPSRVCMPTPAPLWRSRGGHAPPRRQPQPASSPRQSPGNSCVESSSGVCWECVGAIAGESWDAHGTSVVRQLQPSRCAPQRVPTPESPVRMLAAPDSYHTVFAVRALHCSRMGAQTACCVERSTFTAQGARPRQG